MSWYKQKPIDPIFEKWLDSSTAIANDSVLRVWDGERQAAINALYDLFKQTREANAREIQTMQAKIDALNAALTAKQTIEVNFSMFGRRKS